MKRHALFWISSLIFLAVLLSGCDALKSLEDEPIHVTLTIEVLVLDEFNTPRSDTNVYIETMKSTVDKDGFGHDQLDTKFTTSKFTDVNGKTSFTVDYTLHNNPQERIDVKAHTIYADPGFDIITYNDAKNVAGENNIAVLSSTITLYHLIE